MNSRVLLIRAISGEFIERKTKSMIKIICVIFIITLIGIFYLASLNVWWWLLIIPVVLLSLLMLGLKLLVKLAISKIRPNHTSSQKAKISFFVDKLEAIIEN